MKKKNGITLISVIVTVVVLLIITVISINSENGMLEKADKTTSIVEEKILSEENRMAEHDVDNVFSNFVGGVYAANGDESYLVMKSNKIIIVDCSEENAGILTNTPYKVYTKKDILELVPEDEHMYVEAELKNLEAELGIGRIDCVLTVPFNTGEEGIIGIIFNGGKQIFLYMNDENVIINKTEKTPENIRKILEKTKNEYSCYINTDSEAEEENKRTVIIDYKNQMINSFILSEEFLNNFGGAITAIGAYTECDISENTEIDTLQVNGEKVTIGENSLKVTEKGKEKPCYIIDGSKLYISTEASSLLQNGTIIHATLENDSDAVVLTEKPGYRITDLGLTAK